MPENIVIGVLKEAKAPAERRAPLSPEACRLLMDEYPGVTVKVEQSDSRCFADQEYRDLGVEVVDDISSCDWLLGVKEIDPDKMIAGKSYMFFSHTIKQQPFNKTLLQKAIEKKITLVDYECLRGDDGKRLIGFGRYAGIVGAYNALLFYCQRAGQQGLKRAHEVKNLQELYAQLEQFNLPSDLRIVVTGRGRVGGGVVELLEAAQLNELEPAAFMAGHEAGFTVLSKQNYLLMGGVLFDQSAFEQDSMTHASHLSNYLESADIYIAAHYWQNDQPCILSKSDLDQVGRLSLISDISCDIEGGLATTVKATTIDDPIFYHNNDEQGVLITSIDNLPCELPRAATRGFGAKLVEVILPLVISGQASVILDRATIAKEGKLGDDYRYLAGYAGV